MATKQEIQQRLERLIVKADPMTAVELRELQRQITDSREIGVSITSISKKAGQILSHRHLKKDRHTHSVLKKILLTNEDNYTVEEVAERFGVTRQAVHKWISDDKIKYIAPPNGKRKGYLIPKDQFKPISTRGEEFRRRRDEIFGGDEISLVDPQDVFRSGEVKE